MKYMNNGYGNSRVFGNARCRLPLNLQFFAEDGNDGGAGEGGNAGGSGGSEEGGNDGGGEGGTPSFDEMLQNPSYQSEFDKRVAKALETSRTKIEKDVEARIQNAKTEAEKLAKMNADQKAEYEKEKREKELSDREAAINKRELTAQAKETLVEKGLPLELSEVLDYTSADTCNKSIEAVSKAFQSAVEKAVENKIKGGKPPKKPDSDNQTLEDQIMNAMSGN